DSTSGQSTPEHGSGTAPRSPSSGSSETRRSASPHGECQAAADSGQDEAGGQTCPDRIASVAGIKAPRSEADSPEAGCSQTGDAEAR
ncbi:MAG: hypothetical protein AAFR55_07570, partial [Pseudomonadota bacterium]